MLILHPPNQHKRALCTPKNYFLLALSMRNCDHTHFNRKPYKHISQEECFLFLKMQEMALPRSSALSAI